MPYVIAEPCVATCETACVDACPTDCIHGPISPREIARIPPEDRTARLAAIQLYIDPEACIDCGACASHCPVGAIFAEEDLPPAWDRYREINAGFFAGR